MLLNMSILGKKEDIANAFGTDPLYLIQEILLKIIGPPLSSD